jgi:hypothetical protein
MPDPITMDGEYAYACDPYTKARILCVDAPGNLTVLSMDARCNIYWHHADGRATFDSRHNLVPLQRRPIPVEAWGYVGPGNRLIASYETRDEAKRSSIPAQCPGSRLVRLIEDPELRP